MTQKTLELFAPLSERPPLTPARARRSDPATSSEAADAVNRSGSARAHEELILDVLWRSSVALTACEIGARADLTNVQVCRRIGSRSIDSPSLEGRGLVERSTPRTCRCSEHRGAGRRMVTWRAR